MYSTSKSTHLSINHCIVSDSHLRFNEIGANNKKGIKGETIIEKAHKAKQARKIYTVIYGHNALIGWKILPVENHFALLTTLHRSPAISLQLICSSRS